MGVISTEEQRNLSVDKDGARHLNPNNGRTKSGKVLARIIDK